MKAKFIVSPTIKSSDGGVERVRTDMLMLTKIEGMGLGAGPRAVDELMQGEISARIAEKDFRGALGRTLVIKAGDPYPAENVLMIGLGRAASFDPCALVKVVETAVGKALARKCSRLTVPIVANRMTALNINLRGTAHIIRLVAERKLAEVDEDGTLEIEILCTSQAKRHIDEGLAIPCRSKEVVCCKGADE